MIILKKSKLVKEMIMRQTIYQTTIISKNIQQLSNTNIEQQELDSDPKAIQQINFTRNLEQQATIFFIIEEA